MHILKIGYEVQSDEAEEIVQQQEEGRSKKEEEEDQKRKSLFFTFHLPVSTESQRGKRSGVWNSQPKKRGEEEKRCCGKVSMTYNCESMHIACKLVAYFFCSWPSAVCLHVRT